MSDLSQSKAPFFFQTNKPKKKTSRSDSTVPCPCVYAIYAEGDAQASNNEANEKEEGEAAAPAAAAEEEEEEEGEIEEGEAPPDDDSDQGKTRHEYEEIVAGWKPEIAEIESWLEKKKLDLPVLFTELGTCSYKGSSKAPYAYPDDVAISEKEQEHYYRAFFESFADREWLNGVYWWWWDNPSTGDYMGNKGEANSQYAYLYTPQGKAAEEVLKEYYT